MLKKVVVERPHELGGSHAPKTGVAIKRRERFKVDGASRGRWRGFVDRFRGNVWLDGVIASLAVAAFGAAVIFDKVISTTGGSPLMVATNLAYPLADLLLLALAVATFALTGWRFDRTWALVAYLRALAQR